MKIFIDPGHGGSDPGAVNEQVGAREATVNLDVSLKLNTILQNAGFTTKLSRTTDTYVSLGERARMANEWGADYFISVHCNSFSNENANGTETIYYPNSTQSQLLASAIQNQLVAQLNRNDRGVVARNLAVLRLTNMPAVLVELAFISNPTEGYLLTTDQFQQKSAQAIANGLQDYLR